MRVMNVKGSKCISMFRGAWGGGRGGWAANVHGCWLLWVCKFTRFDWSFAAPIYGLEQQFRGVDTIHIAVRMFSMAPVGLGSSPRVHRTPGSLRGNILHHWGRVVNG